MITLKRYMIKCMNPVKRDWTGEIVTTGNDTVGTVRKFIPYNCPIAESCHIPDTLVDVIRNRKYLETTLMKDSNGNYYIEKSRKIEFILTELPYLTSDEMHQITKQQRIINQ